MCGRRDERREPRAVRGFADALSGADGLQPQVQFNMTTLENASNPDCELLAAGLALFEAVPDFAFRVLFGWL